MERCPYCGHVIKGKACLHCQLEDYDNDAYVGFAGPAVREKAINTLIGLLKGIVYDNIIVKEEVDDLYSWYSRNIYFINDPIFKALFDKIEELLLCKVMTHSDYVELLQLAEAYSKDNHYFDVVTTDLQLLQGILEGIISDSKITKAELEALSDWLDDHEHLQSFYPYDEIYTLITKVLKDGIVDKDEEAFLKVYFAQFTHISPDKLVKAEKLISIKSELSISGICSMDPVITFEKKIFTFTGKSARGTRADFCSLVEERGGVFKKDIVKHTDYLIIGAEGNVCWAFNCYGRKIEKAIQMRKDGSNIILINEHDFWDTLE